MPLFLADESCDFAVVRALRAAGYDVLSIAELRESSGVILIRFPADERPALPAAVLAAVTQLGDRLTGAFVVLTPRRIRIGRDPRA